jgi:hypothetical protein
MANIRQQAWLILDELAFMPFDQCLRHLQKLKCPFEKVFQAFYSINTSKDNLRKIKHFRYFQLV